MRIQPPNAYLYIMCVCVYVCVSVCVCVCVCVWVWVRTQVLTHPVAGVHIIAKLEYR